MNRRIVARRLAVATSGLLLTLASTAGPAVAHEGDDHEGGGGPPEPFVIECEGVEYTVTSANGNWAVAIDREAGAVFIPKAFSFTITGYDAEGNEFFSETETDVKGNGNAHKNQQTVTCTFGGTETDEEGNTFVFDGSAVVVRRS